MVFYNISAPYPLSTVTPVVNSYTIIHYYVYVLDQYNIVCRYITTISIPIARSILYQRIIGGPRLSYCNTIYNIIRRTLRKQYTKYTLGTHYVI